MQNNCFAPRSVKSGVSIKLAMQRLRLSGQILAAGANLLVHHEFESAEDAPIEVVYGFILPRDSAMREFKVEGAGVHVKSDLRRASEASKAYEDAIASGAFASMARQYGDGIVNLTVGNLRPREQVTVTLNILAGIELHDHCFRFRFPFTLAPSYHKDARTAAVGDHGEQELPAEDFGDLILPEFHKNASNLHSIGFRLRIPPDFTAEDIHSPSHPIRVIRNHVELAPDRDVPDRDLVLEFKTESKVRSVSGGGRFAVAIPSVFFGETVNLPRRVVFLLDRSGSMKGLPMEQAKNAILACLGTLAPADEFGIVAFDNVTEPFRPNLSGGTSDNRRAAEDFLSAIDARGGTELSAGLEAASAILGKNPGAILAVTDGQVFATESILETARHKGAQLHCLGIGSASQDRFLATLASQTGGTSRFLTPRERVDIAAVDMFASIGSPAAQHLHANLKPADSIEIPPPATVFTGSGVLVAGKGTGPIALEWKTSSGSLVTREIILPAEEDEIGETLRLLEGSRKIADLESRVAGKGRESERIREQLIRLSEEYGLASREMSLVAVVRRDDDRPGTVPKTIVVPVGVPQDLEFASYFGNARLMTTACMRLPEASMGRIESFLAISPTRWKKSQRIRSSKTHTDEDLLIELSKALEPDGGMPGPDTSTRYDHSLVALLFFLQMGNTAESGTFRKHVARLRKFLESSPDPLIRRIAAENAVRGDWREHVRHLLRSGSLERASFEADVNRYPRV